MAGTDSGDTDLQAACDTSGMIPESCCPIDTSTLEISTNIIRDLLTDFLIKQFLDELFYLQGATDR